MPSDISRRTFLRTSAFASATVVAGCSTFELGGGGSNSGDGDDSYSFEIENEITAGDFEDTDVSSDMVDAEKVPKQSATVTVTVEKVVADTGNELIYKQTADVPPNSSKTLEDQFTVPTDDNRYAMEAALEPIVEDPSNTTRLVDREDGITFKPGEYGVPTIDPIRVRVEDSDESNWLVPDVTLLTHARS